MSDVEDEEISQALLLSLRENYRDDVRYLNEDNEVQNLRNQNDFTQRNTSPTTSDEDDDLQAAIRASLADAGPGTFQNIPQTSRDPEPTPHSQSIAEFERSRAELKI